MDKGKPFTVGMMVFPDVVQLDATGPYEVLCRTPGIEVKLVAKTLDPIRTKEGLTLLPDVDFTNAPRFDMFCIPGGAGVDPLFTDDETIAYVRKAAAEADLISAVCTGTLLAGAAGLLKGRKATTHWTTGHFLQRFDCEYVDERVVVDGNLITGAGVTSGIDFGFVIVEMIAGRQAAARVMLSMEYDPAPPFRGGRPENTAPAIVEAYLASLTESQAFRSQQIAAALAKLG